MANEKSRAYFRAYYLRNRKRYLEYNRRARRERPHIKLRQRASRYGLSLVEVETMRARQNNVCAICRRPETATRNGKVRDLSIDHDHRTGVVRGLICQRCNSVLGYVDDSVLILRAATDYLEKSRG